MRARLVALRQGVRGGSRERARGEKKNPTYGVYDALHSALGNRMMSEAWARRTSGKRVARGFAWKGDTCLLPRKETRERRAVVPPPCEIRKTQRRMHARARGKIARILRHCWREVRAEPSGTASVARPAEGGWLEERWGWFGGPLGPFGQSCCGGCNRDVILAPVVKRTMTSGGRKDDRPREEWEARIPGEAFVYRQTPARLSSVQKIIAERWD